MVRISAESCLSTGSSVRLIAQPSPRLPSVEAALTGRSRPSSPRQESATVAETPREHLEATPVHKIAPERHVLDTREASVAPETASASKRKFRAACEPQACPSPLLFPFD